MSDSPITTLIAPFDIPTATFATPFDIPTATLAGFAAMGLILWLALVLVFRWAEPPVDEGFQSRGHEPSREWIRSLDIRHTTAGIVRVRHDDPMPSSLSEKMSVTVKATGIRDYSGFSLPTDSHIDLRVLPVIVSLQSRQRIELSSPGHPTETPVAYIGPARLPGDRRATLPGDLQEGASIPAHTETEIPRIKMSQVAAVIDEYAERHGISDPQLVDWKVLPAESRAHVTTGTDSLGRRLSSQGEWGLYVGDPSLTGISDSRD